jgi:hypothetical protein
VLGDIGRKRSATRSARAGARSTLQTLLDYAVADEIRFRPSGPTTEQERAALLATIAATLAELKDVEASVSAKKR